MATANDDPLYSGEMRARADLTLAAILRALLVVLPVMIVASLLGDSTLAAKLTLLLALPYTLALFFLQRRGHFEVCVYAIVYGMIVFGAVIAALYGSVRSAGVVGQVAAITVGGIFLRRRSLILAAGLAIASIALLIYAENANWLPAPNYAVTPVHWVFYSMIIAAVALVLSYMRTLLIDLVKRLHRELDQRQRAEAGREQSEDRFRRVFESSPVGMSIMRVSDGRCLDSNRADQRTLGYRREEVIGRTPLEMGVWLSEEDRERFLAQVRAGNGPLGFDARMRNKAGEIVDIRIWADRVMLDGEACVLSSTINLTEQERADRLRRQSEAKYAAVFNNTPDPVAIARERDGVQLEANDAWVRQTGFARERAIGKSSLELGLWADLAQRENALAQIRTIGAIENFPARFRIANGLQIDVLLSGRRVTLDGEPCIVWSWREVTELRRAQAQEHQIRAKFERLFDISPEGIAVTRWKDAVLIEANDSALAQIGLSREQAIGQSVLELGIGAGTEDNAAIFSQLIAEGRVINRSTRFRRHDGAWMEYLLSAATLSLDGERCVVWSWRDVTEQRRQQQALADSEERFSKAFEASQEAIAISSLPDGRLISVNQRAAELYGMPAAEMLGKTSQELNLWDAATRDRLIELMRTERKVRNLELKVNTRKGEALTCEYSAEILELGGVPHAIGFLRDMTAQRRAEDERRQAQAHFAAAFTNSPDGILISRLRDGKVMAVNDAWVAQNGYAREAVIDHSLAELGAWPAEERAAYVKELQTNGRVSNFLATLRRADGTRRQTLLSAIPVEMNGEPCVMSLGRDVTEMRRVEEALRDSEQRYRSLFQAAMDCILVVSPGGTILDANEYGCRALGYEREELLGDSFTRIFEQSKLSRMLPRPPQVKVERRTLRDEQEIRARDGGLRRVEFTAGPLPDGNVLVVARDVSERRKQELLLEKIAHSVGRETGADFFRSLVLALAAELPADVVFIGEIVGAGGTVRTVACCSDGRLVGNFDYPLAGSPSLLAIERRGTVVQPDRAAEDFPQDQVLAGRGIAGYAGTSLFDASGKAIGVLVALTRKPIARKDFVVSLLEIFAARAAAEIERARADAQVRELNVSLERRVRERTTELEAANRDLDSFGYSVSHDLRSPLGALNGFAHLLRTHEAGRLSAEGVHLLRQLETNATRMTNLVEGLLEFSRLGRKPVMRMPVPMAALVDEVVEDLRAESRNRVIDFRVGTIPETYGDPMLLRQVWKNLIGNAVKYSRGRDPAVIEVGFDAAAGEYYVRDNGAGFDMQYAGRLFGVFERLHTESEFEGTGVGLAIVQRIVKRHGGTIRGEGRPERGAAFHFTLPVR